jgi:hypothetical protein
MAKGFVVLVPVKAPLLKSSNHKEECILNSIETEDRFEGEFEFTSKDTYSIAAKQFIKSNISIPFEDYITQEYWQPKSDDSSIPRCVSSFVKKLSVEAYENGERKPNTLKVVFGINHADTLCHTCNSESLKLLLNDCEPNTTGINVKIVAYRWARLWRNKNMEFVDQKDVMEDFKRLCPLQKSEFLRREAQSRPPYNIIREFLKNSEEAKQQFRSFEHGAGSVFTTFLDFDTRNFNNVFSRYEMLINDKNPPYTLMTTGYEFEDEDYLPAKVATQMDRVVRIATCQIPGLDVGVYIPEPNFCVLIPPNHESIPESFVEYTYLGKRRCVRFDYKEGPTLIEQVRQRTGFTYKFFQSNPLITATPHRALEQAKLFSSKMKDIGRPTQEDLKHLVNFTQSHLSEMWVTSLTFHNHPLRFSKRTLKLVCKFEENKILLEKELPQFQRLSPAAKNVLELAVAARNDAFEYVVHLAKKNGMDTWLASSEALWDDGWLYDVPILTQLELYYDYDCEAHSISFNTFVQFYSICVDNDKVKHFSNIIDGAIRSPASFESIVSACDSQGWKLKRLYKSRIDFCKFLVRKGYPLHKADHANLDSDEEYELRETLDFDPSSDTKSQSSSEDSNYAEYDYDEDDEDDLEISYWEDD